MAAQTDLVHVTVTYPSIMKMQISSGFEVDPSSIKVNDLKEKIFNDVWAQFPVTKAHGSFQQVILKDRNNQVISKDEDLTDRLSSGSTCFSVVFSRS